MDATTFSNVYYINSSASIQSCVLITDNPSLL